jgi:O-antigen/teichoic acid export membrane protein
MLKAIALSSVVSSLFITIVTIPLYYFLGFEGIVPVIITSSAVSLLVNVYYTRKISTQKVTMTLSETFQKGKPLMRLGFLLSINIIFGQICTYLIKLYLNGSGTSSQILGFYEVSTVILVSYLGMIFNAMGNDFYPRLTSTIEDNVKVKQLVNNQIEVALLLVVPAIVALYLGAPLLIDLLYTKEFVGVLPILKAGLFSVIIKAVIWPLSFIILSKGDNKQYFKQELFGDFMNIFLTILFYNYWGLLGIGLASVINFSIYGVYVYAVVQRKYAFSFTAECWTYIWKALLVGLSSMLLVFFVDYPYAYYPLSGLLLITLFYSYKKLNQLVDLAFYFNKIKNKFR